MVARSGHRPDLIGSANYPEPIQIKNGHALIPDRPRSGITWNEDAVKRYAVA